jgi:NitT/TauT family transport system ATP-binding protein
MIRFQNVTKSFGGLQVLKNVSIEVKAHETIAVLGDSGSGKTTLLRLVAGTLKPDGGSITVGSTRIAYVFQDHRLLPWRTAQDNIALILKAGGLGPKAAREKARSWMDRLGLRGFYKYYPGQLSGGMIQRISIARAFAIEPEVMLMDEPFSSLDADLADSLLRDLKQVLADYRTTTVYVTHDLVEALSIAQRIFRLGSEGLTEMKTDDRREILQGYMEERLRIV